MGSQKSSGNSQRSGQSSQRDERSSAGGSQRADAQKSSPNFDDSPDRGGKGGDKNVSVEGGSRSGQRDTLPQYGDNVPGDPRKQHVEAQGDEGSMDSGSDTMGTE